MNDKNILPPPPPHRRESNTHTVTDDATLDAATANAETTLSAVSSVRLNDDLLNDKSSTAVSGAAYDASPPHGFLARVWFFWSLFVAGFLLLFIGSVTIPVCYLLNKREWLYPFCLFGGRTWLKLSGARIHVKGLERLDPKQTYIFAANHRSYLDTAALFCHLDRRIGLFAKKELLKVPVMGYGMGYVNIMAIDRSSLERAATTVRAATDKIRAGRSFGVFVEGRRAPQGELLPFKKGAFYMAMETGVPIVPVVFRNTDILMGKSGYARPGDFEMEILEPIPTQKLKGDDDAVKLLLETTRARIAGKL